MQREKYHVLASTCTYYLFHRVYILKCSCNFLVLLAYLKNRLKWSVMPVCLYNKTCQKQFSVEGSLCWISDVRQCLFPWVYTIMLDKGDLRSVKRRAKLIFHEQNIVKWRIYIDKFFLESLSYFSWTWNIVGSGFFMYYNFIYNCRLRVMKFSFVQMIFHPYPSFKS